jgi:hypothetical protein
MRLSSARLSGALTTVRGAWRSDAVLTLLLAAAYFQVVWGFSIVDPTNLDWIFAVERDLTRYLTSVAYFRTSSWSFPITSFDSMAYPIGTSITNADGIPLFAVPYKLLDPLLPERVFQYFGIWLFCCVWLQALFAKKIMSSFGLPVPVQWVGVLLSTADLPQALALWHAALWAHWTFLAGFYLVLQRELPLKRTAALVFLVTWIHPYLLAMVLATVVATFVKQRRTERLVMKVAVVLGALLLSSFLVGYFHLPTGEAKTGDYQADLFALVNSSGTGLVPALVPIRHFDEGYAYLGLGGIVLAVLLVVGSVATRAKVLGLHELPLLFVCLAMGTYAFSASPRVLGHELGPIPGLSELLSPVQARLRCNGRFLWPLWHYIVLFGVANAWRMFREEKAARGVVAGVLALQVVDVGPWLSNIKRPIPDPPVARTVPPEVEAALTERSRLLLFVPPVLNHPCSRSRPWRGRPGRHWGAALFGAVHGLKTNSDFFALARNSREDSKVICKFTEKIRDSADEHPEVIFFEPPAR